MKTRYVLLAAVALAALVVWGVRPGQKDTAAAEGDSALLAMTIPAANASTVIEPRDSITAFPTIPASTTPASSPAPVVRNTKPAPVTKVVPATTPPKTTTPPQPTEPESTATRVPVASPSPAAPLTPTPIAAPTTPAPRRAAVAGVLTLQPGSRLWFDGSSSVKDFTCKAKTLTASVVTSSADAAVAVVAGEKSVTSVELTVPVSSLDCDNGTMNNHMRNALDAKAHPTIMFALSSYDLVKGGESVAVTLTGSLTIHGKSLPVTLQAQATGGAEGALHLTGVYELNMKEYGVKPPSLMLGTMNVREKVKVRFDLLLRD